MNTTALSNPTPAPDRIAFARHDAVPPFPEPEPAATPTQCLALILDEIDYGVLLVENQNEVVYRNHTACRELCDDHPLWLDGGRLRARGAESARTLDASLRSASQQGLRRMITLGSAERALSVAVIPLCLPGRAPLSLVMLGRRSLCQPLSAQGFAHCNGLTPAEAAVLAALSCGRSPGSIARSQGVALSTVRTHITKIRAKTGAASIRNLLERVAQLPPMVSALRH